MPVMEINKGRWTARVDGDFVVFLIGAELRDADQAGPVAQLLVSMVDMLTELEQDPTKGLLGYQVYGDVGGVIVQYWLLRSTRELRQKPRCPTRTGLAGLEQALRGRGRLRGYLARDLRGVGGPV
jgi:hypothetical protein